MPPQMRLQTPFSLRSDAGAIVASILAGAWRADPPHLAIASEDLARVASLLIDYGGGALAWNRVSRQPSLRDTPAAAHLQNIHRFLALEEVRKQASLRFVAELFGAAGLEPMIFKGWAVAQHYAKAHLRPFGDFDLCAPPGRHAEAAELLGRRAVPGLESPKQGIVQALGQFVLDCGAAGTLCHVDLHANLDKFRLPRLETVHARAQRIGMGAHGVRVLGAEDHLRLVALHFLIHGGFRPLWLCDVAAMLESLRQGFCWEDCFGDDPRTARWIACVFELAHQLLGARIDHVPEKYRVHCLPAWLVRTVLTEWQAPFTTRIGLSPSRWVARPWVILGELKLRWPNAIAATVAYDGRFGDRPLWRYQAASFLRWGIVAIPRRLLRGYRRTSSKQPADPARAGTVGPAAPTMSPRNVAGA
jgi:hypothetical protein